MNMLNHMFKIKVFKSQKRNSLVDLRENHTFSFTLSCQNIISIDKDRNISSNSRKPLLARLNYFLIL